MTPWMRKASLALMPARMASPTVFSPVAFS